MVAHDLEDRSLRQDPKEEPCGQNDFQEEKDVPEVPTAPVFQKVTEKTEADG
jgi:hypothetical protein